MLDRPGGRSDMTHPGDYLWIHDMEWFPHEDVRTFKFQSYHRDGYVPFAHTGSGDFWAWCPAMQEAGVVPVVLCPHDYAMGELYAPHLAPAMYRQALEFALGEIDDLQERQAMIRRWVIDLAELWPQSWRERLERLTDRVLEWDEYQDVVRTDVGERYLGHVEFQWMKDIE